MADGTVQRSYRLDIEVSAETRARMALIRALIEQEQFCAGVVSWAQIVEFVVSSFPVEQLLLAKIRPAAQHERKSDE